MNKLPRSAENRLFQIASQQQGYFTTHQAIESGFQDATHPYHVRRGDWVRENRGIYRISRYPQSTEGQYVLWSLWSRNREGVHQGVYSHQTALSLFELSDIMPDKLYMTVPASFRRHSEIPGVLVLRRGKIVKQEIDMREGYSVTKPVRTIVDLILEKSVSVDIIRQALREAKRRGLLRMADFQSYRTDAMAAEKIDECVEVAQ